MTDVRALALRDLLLAVDGAWTAMLERTTPAVRRVRIAGIDVEIVLAGDELAKALLPAFECHPETSAPAQATVGAWDGEATGCPLPEPLPARDPLVRWIVRRDGRPVAEASWRPDGAVAICSRITDRHLLGVARVADLSPWEAGAPLRRQLWWAIGTEALFVHAGAVGDESGVALIMGASGAGKSTTTLACLRAGMGFLSDDYCLVRGDPPVAHVLAATARAHDNELRNLDFDGPSVIAGLRADAGDGPMKALLFVNRVAPDRVVASAPVRVVLIPEFTEATAPRLVPIGPMDALRAVAPAALWQMHVDADRELASLSTLIRAVPSYRLLLSRDRYENPKAVQEALSR